MKWSTRRGADRKAHETPNASPVLSIVNSSATQRGDAQRRPLSTGLISSLVLATTPATASPAVVTSRYQNCPKTSSRMAQSPSALVMVLAILSVLLDVP